MNNAGPRQTPHEPTTHAPQAHAAQYHPYQGNHQYAPQQGGYPGVQPSAYVPSRSGMAVAGLVLGIIALLTSFLPIVNNFAFLLALLGLIFAIVGLAGIVKGKKVGKGMAVAAVVLNALSLVIVLATQAMFSSALDEASKQLDEGVVSAEGVSVSSDDAPASDAAAPADAPAASEGQGLASEAEPEVPAEYRSALKKAQSYNDTMHMSKAGLYDQLTSEYGEKFSAEAAQYAVDNVNADWNANALAKARSYQETMSMSPEAIRDQLTSEYGEKFTQEEADYAVENL